MSTTDIRVLSLGAGVQSTTLALLSARGLLPRLDAAIFADTGWEPKAVYHHLERLRTEVLEPAGIPLHVVAKGNLRTDTISGTRQYVTMPVFLQSPDGTGGISMRTCTDRYKIGPVREKTRELLGAPTVDGKVMQPQRGKKAEQWIGISLDEVERAKDSQVGYVVNEFPLLDLKWTRNDCHRYLAQEGWQTTPKSACIGCPFHGNRAWRELRDGNAEEWADAVAFDAALRTPEFRARINFDGEAFLHRSRLPLSVAPIERPQRDENQTGDMLEAIRDAEWEEAEEPPGCSPFSCRNDGL